MLFLKSGFLLMSCLTVSLFFSSEVEVIAGMGRAEAEVMVEEGQQEVEVFMPRCDEPD
jgi:hypothetical protein